MDFQAVQEIHLEMEAPYGEDQYDNTKGSGC